MSNDFILEMNIVYNKMNIKLICAQYPKGFYRPWRLDLYRWVSELVCQFECAAVLTTYGCSTPWFGWNVASERLT
jgi:hypothetical protein